MLHHLKRAVFEIKGPDAVSFLQGVLTSDVTKLAAQKIQYAAMLTPQGRFHFDCFLYHHREEHILLETDAAFAQDFFKRLRLYKLRADVVLKDISEEICVVTSATEEEGLLKDPRHLEAGYRGLLAFLPADIDTDTAPYHLMSVKLCLPRAGIELIPEKTIPLEANFEELGALCFDKGCYLGQELTTRTKHQGMVRKKLYTVQLIKGQFIEEEGMNSPELPLSLYYDDQKVGQLLSLQSGYGIAKLRIEDVEDCQKIGDFLKASDLHFSIC